MKQQDREKQSSGGQLNLEVKPDTKEGKQGA